MRSRPSGASGGAGPRARGVVLVLAAALLGGCTFVWAAGEPDCSVSRPSVVITEPEVEETVDGANFGIDAYSTYPDALRLTVRANGGLALDVELPENHACSHQPISRHEYRLPDGPVRITVTTSAGQEESLLIRDLADMRWVVIAAQHGFPLSVTESDEQPGWG